MVQGVEQYRQALDANVANKQVAPLFFDETSLVDPTSLTGLFK